MSSGNAPWDAHLERLRRVWDPAPRVAPRQTARRAVTHAEAAEAVAGEWNAEPPGRLGRRLLVDIEPYLDFFATARS